MSYLLEVPVVGGRPVYLTVTADDEDRVIPTARSGEAVVKAARSFQDNLEPLAAVADAFIDRFRHGDPPPDEVTMEFGFDIRAEGGIVILGTKTGAAFKVTLTWRGSSEPAAGG